MRLLLCAAVMALCLTSQAFAVFDLQISEIWSGNFPNDSNGDNQTGDWFEVTNLGDMPWTAGVDGNLYYDDDSADPLVADLMSGVPVIAPGESVVFVDDDNNLPVLTLAIWHGLWDTKLTDAGKTIPQVGYYAGAGLSGGGDTVNIFLDTDGTVTVGDIIDAESYDDAEAFGGQSWDVGLGIYSHPSFSVVTDANDMGNPSTGTPGYIPVPEPVSMALCCLGLALIGFGRRK